MAATAVLETLDPEVKPNRRGSMTTSCTKKSMVNGSRDVP